VTDSVSNCEICAVTTIAAAGDGPAGFYRRLGYHPSRERVVMTLKLGGQVVSPDS